MEQSWKCPNCGLAIAWKNDNCIACSHRNPERPYKPVTISMPVEPEVVPAQLPYEGGYQQGYPAAYYYQAGQHQSGTTYPYYGSAQGSQPQYSEQTEATTQNLYPQASPQQYGAYLPPMQYAQAAPTPEDDTCPFCDQPLNLNSSGRCNCCNKVVA